MERDPNIYETCIMCKTVTPVLKSTNIEWRTGYIEGAGQLCYSCWSGDQPLKTVCVTESEIINTPNDMELGGAVRSKYYKSKEL